MGDIDSKDLAYLAVTIECYHYAQEHMYRKPRFADRKELLLHSLSNVSLPGLVLEFGVFVGETINYIADNLPAQKIYGFDSFEGLPEAWVDNPPGFLASGALPAVRDNVELVVGWFDRSLPAFLDEHPGEPAAFVHVDCDVYSSTQIVLTQLRDRIVPGTIIQFDEYWNYPEWKRHEYAAFQEFINHNRMSYEYIGLVPLYQQVAVRILP